MEVRMFEERLEKLVWCSADADKMVTSISRRSPPVGDTTHESPPLGHTTPTQSAEKAATIAGSEGKSKSSTPMMWRWYQASWHPNLNEIKIIFKASSSFQRKK